MRFEGFSLRSLFTIHITSVARAMKVPLKFGSSVQFGKRIASYKGQILRGYIQFERSEGGGVCLCVCCKFCDIDIQHLFGFNSECQSYSGQFTLQEQEQQFH